MNYIVRIVLSVVYFLSLLFLTYWFLLYLDTRSKIKKERSHYKKSFKLDHYPGVSILIPAHNEEKTIIATLKSVTELNYPKDKVQILVLDNASEDKTGELTRRFIEQNPGSDIKYFFIKEAGKANAMNFGLSKIDSKYFACLDADSYVHKDALKEMMKKFENSGEDYKILTPVMKVGNPKTLMQKIQRVEYIFAAMMAKLTGYMDSVYVAPGPFSVYKTKFIKKVGGFNKKSIVEDQEIAYRVQRNNKKIAQCSNAFVYTNAPKNIKQFRQQRNRWIRGTILTLKDNRDLLFNKKYGDFGNFQLPLILIYYLMGLVGLSVAVFYFFKPIYQNIKNLLLLNFDLMPFIVNYKITFNIWNLDFFFTFMIYTLLIGSFLFLYVASRTTDEKMIRSYGIIPMVLYFFIYFLLLSTIFIDVLIQMLRKKESRW